MNIKVKRKEETGINDDECPMCGEHMQKKYRLYDLSGEASGDFCSKNCAESEAWGPKFREYKIRKIPGHHSKTL
jgi:ferredoxin